MEKMKRWSMFEKDADLKPESRGQMLELLSWLRLAYKTLRTPHLQKIYVRRLRSVRKEPKEIQVAADRLLFDALCEVERHDLPLAIKKFEAAEKLFPEDLLIKAYLGWSLFLHYPENHFGDSAKLIDAALEEHTADPDLRYFRGKIFAFRGQWKQAEHNFAMAYRLDPEMKVAGAALDRVRHRLRKKS